MNHAMASKRKKAHALSGCFSFHFANIAVNYNFYCFRLKVIGVF